MKTRARTAPRSGKPQHKVPDPFYRSKPWYRFRWFVLRRDNFTCTQCGTYIGKKGAHVDHIVSRAQRPDLAFDQNNATTLCHGCHSSKTVKRDGGFGNRKRGPEEPTGECNAAGMPTDPGHPWNR